MVIKTLLKILCRADQRTDCTETRIDTLIEISASSQVHKISNNVVCATSQAADQPAHTRNLTRAFASRLSIL